MSEDGGNGNGAMEAEEYRQYVIGRALEGS